MTFAKRVKPNKLPALTLAERFEKIVEALKVCLSFNSLMNNADATLQKEKTLVDDALGKDEAKLQDFVWAPREFLKYKQDIRKNNDNRYKTERVQLGQPPAQYPAFDDLAPDSTLLSMQAMEDYLALQREDPVQDPDLQELKSHSLYLMYRLYNAVVDVANIQDKVGNNAYKHFVVDSDQDSVPVNNKRFSVKSIMSVCWLIVDDFLDGAEFGFKKPNSLGELRKRHSALFLDKDIPLQARFGCIIHTLEREKKVFEDFTEGNLRTLELVLHPYAVAATKRAHRVSNNVRANKRKNDDEDNAEAAGEQGSSQAFIVQQPAHDEQRPIKRRRTTTTPSIAETPGGQAEVEQSPMHGTQNLMPLKNQQPAVTQHGSNDDQSTTPSSTLKVNLPTDLTELDAWMHQFLRNQPKTGLEGCAKMVEGWAKAVQDLQTTPTTAGEVDYQGPSKRSAFSAQMSDHFFTIPSNPNSLVSATRSTTWQNPSVQPTTMVSEAAQPLPSQSVKTTHSSSRQGRKPASRRSSRGSETSEKQAELPTGTEYTSRGLTNMQAPKKVIHPQGSIPQHTANHLAGMQNLGAHNLFDSLQAFDNSYLQNNLTNVASLQPGDNQEQDTEQQGVQGKQQDTPEMPLSSFGKERNSQRENVDEQGSVLHTMTQGECEQYSWNDPRLYEMCPNPQGSNAQASEQHDSHDQGLQQLSSYDQQQQSNYDQQQQSNYDQQHASNQQGSNPHEMIQDGFMDPSTLPPDANYQTSAQQGTPSQYHQQHDLNAPCHQEQDYNNHFQDQTYHYPSYQQPINELMSFGRGHDTQGQDVIRHDDNNSTSDIPPDAPTEFNWNDWVNAVE